KTSSRQNSSAKPQPTPSMLKSSGARPLRAISLRSPARSATRFRISVCRNPNYPRSRRGEGVAHAHGLSAVHLSGDQQPAHTEPGLLRRDGPEYVPYVRDDSRRLVRSEIRIIGG